MFFLLVQLCGQCGWAFFVLFSLLVRVFLGDVAIRKDLYENIVLSAGITVLTDVTSAATYNYSNVHAFSSVATTSSNVGLYLSADSTSHPGGTAQPARLALTSPASCLSLLATPDLLSLGSLLSVSSRLFDVFVRVDADAPAPVSQIHIASWRVLLCPSHSHSTPNWLTLRPATFNKIPCGHYGGLCDGGASFVEDAWRKHEEDWFAGGLSGGPWRSEALVE